MSRSPFQNLRRDVLKDVQGKTLEIGFGTGLNIPCYPEKIKKITVLDVNPGMSNRAKKRIKNSQKNVDSFVVIAEKLPFENESFDTVVSTWTLCSIENVELAMQEIYRVLKTGGVFIFIEHGLSKNKKVSKWQKRITPIWKKLGDGCHADRDIHKIVMSYPFEIKKYREYELSKFNKLFSYQYQGVLIKK